MRKLKDGGDFMNDGEELIKYYYNKQDDFWTFTTTTEVYDMNKHAVNCLYCGAPNQTSVCEYCGSALN